MAKKVARDPNAPKRNMSAYLLYQNTMRESFREQNPGMSFGQLAKYTSAMYAEMPPAEKESWVARAEADKQRYLNELAQYVPPPGYDAKGDAIESELGGAGARGGYHAHPQAQAHAHPGATYSYAAANRHAVAAAAATSRPRVGKDHNAPKRNMSAYLLYQNAMREQFKAENPGMTFGQLAKYTSHMYKHLTPEERAVWEMRAAEDKARYEYEIAQYNPPPGFDAHGKSVVEDPHYQHRPRARKTRRTRKDPNAPKRASGAYVFFTNDMRPQVLSEYPGIKFVEMGRIMGERWRSLSPHAKKRYEDQAADDKVRFEREMEAYSASQGLVVQQRNKAEYGGLGPDRGASAQRQQEAAYNSGQAGQGLAERQEAAYKAGHGPAQAQRQEQQVAYNGRQSAAQHQEEVEYNASHAQAQREEESAQRQEAAYSASASHASAHAKAEEGAYGHSPAQRQEEAAYSAGQRSASRQEEAAYNQSAQRHEEGAYNAGHSPSQRHEEGAYNSRQPNAGYSSAQHHDEGIYHANLGLARRQEEVAQTRHAAVPAAAPSNHSYSHYDEPYDAAFPPEDAAAYEPSAYSHSQY